MGVQVDAFPKYPTGLNGSRKEPDFESLEKQNEKASKQ